MAEVQTVRVPITVTVVQGTSTDDQQAVLAEAFNRWLKDWQRDPDSFIKTEEEAYVHDGNITDHSYGASCVRTLNRYLAEVAS